MIVMKFGGSSVKDAEMFRQVADIIKKNLDRKPVVVLSAMKGTTDSLLKCIEEAKDENYDSYAWIERLHKKTLIELGLDEKLLDSDLTLLKDALENIADISKKTKDYISFFGERLSVKILAAYLTKKGIKSIAQISGDAGVLTNNNFGDAALLPNANQLIKTKLSAIKEIPIITGFGGKDMDGNFTTFQRGGSDYVASIIGAAAEADEIQIWTDVDGIMTADPRVVPNAKTIPTLSFDEASELAYFGSKVLHPKTILPAIKRDIPVLVLNTFNPTHPGSRIVSSQIYERKIAAVSFKKGITVLNVKSTRMLDAHGYLSKIFEVFAKHKKSVDMISTSEVVVSMTIDSIENIEPIIYELEKIASVSMTTHKSIITVVGDGLKNNREMPGLIIDTIGSKANILMISQCIDGISVSCVVDEQAAENVVRTLHSKLIQ